MSSFSIIDDYNNQLKKYRVMNVPIFSSTNWNKLLKPNAFSIVNKLSQTVLFTGYLTGFLTDDRRYIHIKIRFNLKGTTDYTYQSLKFYITPANLHKTIHISFVKTFTEIGLYDVWIYVDGTETGYDSVFQADSNDVLCLNATFYHNNTIEDFSTPAYYYQIPPVISH